MTANEPDDQEFELSEGLRALRQSQAPPAAMETQIVKALESRGLLHARQKNPIRWLWPVLAAAACMAGFVAGNFYMQRTRTLTGASAQREFALFLNDAAFEPAPGTEEEAKRVRQYAAWARDLRATSHLIAGEKLGTRTIEISGSQGEHVREGHSAVGGYFVVTAESMDAALAIARTCPHLKYGGSIEIRPIEDTASR